MSEVRELIASVARARTAVLTATAGLSTAAGDFRLNDDEWSIVQIVEHLYLAELSGITKIWAALDTAAAGRLWVGDRPNTGKSIEEVVAATWKAKETAPDISIPRIGGALGAWNAAFASLQTVLERLGDRLEGVDLQAIVFPHFISGPLDARQRIDFLRLHMERHLAQIERLKRHPDFPRSPGLGAAGVGVRA